MIPQDFAKALREAGRALEIALRTPRVPAFRPADDQTAERRLLDLAAALGLKATHLKDTPEFAYVPGHIFYLGEGEERLSNFAHDIAHWLVASPTRRKKKDFGLGDGPDSMGTIKSLLSDKRARAEELLASALGTRIEAWAGHDPSWTLDWHNWDPLGGQAQITVYLLRLNKRGLLRDDLRFSPGHLAENANLW
jgi:hypothetical protein